jgi:serine/threonine protein kinase
MVIFCPNYRCPQRLQETGIELCAACGTPLLLRGKLGENYQLTKVVRISPKKLETSEYYWYELFEAKKNRDQEILIKILVIVPDALTIPSSAEDIKKVKLYFEQEYQLLKKGLPGICRGYNILDVPIEAGAVQMRAIVMEKIAGINLDEYVRTNGSIDSLRALRWLKQLVNTVSSMHKKQVQHRDIKPSNIMISGSGVKERLTLVDFGIGCDLTNSPEPFDSEIGDGPYRDPLCSDCGEYLNHSDFYSLGQTFIFLLTAELPKHDEFSYQSIASLSLDPKLKNVIQRMVSVDVNQRFKSVWQIQRHLFIHFTSRQLKWLKFVRLMFVGLLGSLIASAVIVVMIEYFSEDLRGYAFPVCKYVHCGENPNITLPSGGVDSFQEIIKELSNSTDATDREQQIQTYEKKLDDRRKKKNKSYNDSIGELLIYLNNAKIQFVENTSMKETYLLIVVAPNYENQSITAKMLSGVAQAQKEFNDRNKEHPLYIAIVQEEKDDPGFKNFTKNIKEKYLAKENIYPGINDTINQSSKLIGIMGHYSSESAFPLLEIYKDKKILLVSPLASRAVISDPNIDSKKLEYFARVSGNAEENAGTIEQWLEREAARSNCGRSKVRMVYQSDDSASNSLGIELLKKFKSNKKFNIEWITYKLERGDIETTIDEIKKDIRAKSSNQDKQYCQKTFIFFPGPHMTVEQDDLIISMAKEAAEDSIFISNIPLSTLSKQTIRDEINSDKFYSKAYAIAPYNILDFIPNSSPEHKIDVNFVKHMMNESMSGHSTDILDVDWRQIASADAVRVFTKAIEQYPETEAQKSANRCIQQDSSTVAAVIHDIVKCKGFKANGVSGEIAFDGYERRNAPSGTILKYIHPRGQTRKLVAVPVDYEDPKNPGEYRPRKISELKN